ncbi:MAG: ABC transporter ATP-binding protein/permease [Desulfobacterales bacterium]|jgi:ATP-binding cassette subfamily B protein|nr:ABC transporter ATP-binding protein/permease [Desulfobacterales bacterium]
MKSIVLIKPYFKENRRKIAIGLLSLIIVDVLQLFIPRIIKWTVDGLTDLHLDLWQLLVYAIYMAVIAVLIGAFRYVWRRCLLGTSRRVEEGLRNRLFTHIQTLSASYFDRTPTGDLMAHATNDIQQIRMATGMGMVALNDAIVLGAAAIGFMLYINVTLTLFVLIPMPLITISTLFFSKKMHHRYQAVQAAFSDLTEVIRERFAGIRIIKAHNRKEKEAARVKAVSKEYIKENLGLVKIVGSFFPMLLLFTNLSLAIVLYLGGRQTIAMTISPGDFVAFISYLGILTWPMMALGWVTNLIQRGRASLDRINRILETQPEITNRTDAVALDQIQGGIVFEDVDFAYNHNAAGNAAVLSGIRLKVAPGKALGIVGPPGSGKTTLLSLIPRLYDVSRGTVFLDGKDVRSLQIDNLRSKIAYMPQEPFLFAGTVRENLTFGNPLIKETQLKMITQKAALYDTIRSFPKGFETIVGEKGVILSGGQKQRIALARCLLREGGVLVLDDPISQVDLETGTAIIDMIKSMIGEKTIIIVSHRISAVSFADQIMAMEKGRIIERGTHRELIVTNQYYAKTFQLQEIEEGVNAS